ncbi:MAG: DUF1295 domain-containing protein [Candidatus Paceibacterota bacterium]
MELFLILFGIYFCVVILLATIVFFISQLIENNGIMDVSYGPLFAIAAWSTILISGTYEILPILLATIATMWGVRRGIRAVKKNDLLKESDWYTTLRTEWQANGRVYFILRSFIQLNLLRGIIIVFISLPIIIGVFGALNYSGLFLILGLLISLVGLSIEAFADYQLDQFTKEKKENIEPALIMTKGLFSYTRHPRYFGETLLWWGFAIAVLPLPLGYLGLISPLLATYILTRHTAPKIENSMIETYGEPYETYAARTSYFIPRFPKNISDSNDESSNYQ